MPIALREDLLRSFWFLLFPLILTDCATSRISPSTMPLQKMGYVDVEQGVVIDQYIGVDGKPLAYWHYSGSSPSDTALVYLHGIESHAEWFKSAAQSLSRLGYEVYCLDRRGSGINRENRGFLSGHTASYSTLMADLDRLMDQIAGKYEKIYIIGLSWGGKLAIGYALSLPRKIDGLILITPGIHSAIDLPIINKARVFALSVLYPTAKIEIPIQDDMFSRSEQTLDYIRKDPLRLNQATARFFYESWRLERFICKNIPRNRIPILLFLAENDKIVDNYKVLETLRLGSQESMSIHWYEDQLHSIQMDTTEQLVGDIHQWLISRPSDSQALEENI